MRIGIAARGLSEKSGGVRQYIESMIQALLKIDKENHYVIYYNTKDFLRYCPDAEEKVLFASDHPLCHWNKILPAIESLSISNSFKKKILGKNAAKLLGIKS